MLLLNVVFSTHPPRWCCSILQASRILLVVAAQFHNCCASSTHSLLTCSSSPLSPILLVVAAQYNNLTISTHAPRCFLFSSTISTHPRPCPRCYCSSLTTAIPPPRCCWSFGYAIYPQVPPRCCCSIWRLPFVLNWLLVAAGAFYNCYRSSVISSVPSDNAIASHSQCDPPCCGSTSQ